MYEFLHNVLILAKYRFVGSIERCVETVYARHLVFFAFSIVGLQEDSTEGWRQCQRIKRRDKDTDSHSNTELAIESTAGATHERNGDKH